MRGNDNKSKFYRLNSFYMNMEWITSLTTIFLYRFVYNDYSILKTKSLAVPVKSDDEMQWIVSGLSLNSGSGSKVGICVIGTWRFDACRIDGWIIGVWIIWKFGGWIFVSWIVGWSACDVSMIGASRISRMIGFDSFFLWCITWCRFNALLSQNFFGQMLQWYGVMPVCVRMCTVKLLRSANAFPHCEQECGLTPECTSLWPESLTK